MKVPFLDLPAQFVSIEPGIREAIDRVLKSQHFILGDEVKRFEEEAAAYLGVAHAVGCGSGSDALVLALMALGLEPGDEVLTTPMSYIATAEAIARVGATPVFVDVCPTDLNLSVDAARRHLEERGRGRLRAILPVHIFGRSCDIEGLLALAAEHDLAVVEDAAQAMGAGWNGRKVGTFGDAGCFSFFPSKNLGGYGDGGLVTTNRDDVAALLRRLRVHGAREKYVHDHKGLNSRLDALQAAILRVKLPLLDQWNQARRGQAAAYTEGLAGSEAASPPRDGAGRFDIFHTYVIRASRRDALRQHLDDQGIQTTVYYPLPLHLQPCFESLGYATGDMPEAERAAAEVLSLPIYPELSDEKRSAVVAQVLDFLAAPA